MIKSTNNKGDNKMQKKREQLDKYLHMLIVDEEKITVIKEYCNYLQMPASMESGFVSHICKFSTKKIQEMMKKDREVKTK